MLFLGALGYIGRLFYRSVFAKRGSDEICKECTQYSSKDHPRVGKHPV